MVADVLTAKAHSIWEDCSGRIGMRCLSAVGVGGVGIRVNETSKSRPGADSRSRIRIRGEKVV